MTEKGLQFFFSTFRLKLGLEHIFSQSEKRNTLQGHQT